MRVRQTDSAGRGIGSMKAPWQTSTLADWSIVGMNHYHVNGERRLFVAMVKDGTCIKEEGPDDDYLWNRLHHKVWKLTAPETRERRACAGCGLDATDACPHCDVATCGDCSNCEHAPEPKCTCSKGELIGGWDHAIGCPLRSDPPAHALNR
jgi:hypothetical protein